MDVPAWGRYPGGAGFEVAQGWRTANKPDTRSLVFWREPRFMLTMWRPFRALGSVLGTFHPGLQPGVKHAGLTALPRVVLAIDETTTGVALQHDGLASVVNACAGNKGCVFCHHLAALQGQNEKAQAGGPGGGTHQKQFRPPCKGRTGPHNPPASRPTSSCPSPKSQSPPSSSAGPTDSITRSHEATKGKKSG